MEREGSKEYSVSFLDKGKIFVTRNWTLFSSRQSTWLVLDQPRHPRFLYSIVKESKSLKGNFVFIKVS